MKAFCLLTLLLAAQIAVAQCPVLLNPAPTTLLSNESVHVVEFEVSDKEEETLLLSETLVSFREKIREKALVDPFKNLKRQRDLYFELGFKMERYDEIIAGRFGEITPLNCLEENLLSWHYEQSKNAETEFGAYRLGRPNSPDKLIVLSSSSIVVPENPVALARVKELLESGYILESHIHNHPYLLDNAIDYGGTLVPSGMSGVSGGDIGAYQKMAKDYGLQSFQITNGFSTLHVEKEEYQKMAEEAF